MKKCSCDFEILPIRSDISRINLNCANISIFGCIIDDNIQAEFNYVDHFLDAFGSSQVTKANLNSKIRDAFVETDIEFGNSELVIQIPKAIQSKIDSNFFLDNFLNFAG